MKRKCTLIDFYDASRHLRVTKDELQYLIEDGQIPFKQVRGKIYFFPSDLDDWSYLSILPNYIAS